MGIGLWLADRSSAVAARVLREVVAAGISARSYYFEVAIQSCFSMPFSIEAHLKVNTSHFSLEAAISFEQPVVEVFHFHFHSSVVFVNISQKVDFSWKFHTFQICFHATSGWVTETLPSHCPSTAESSHTLQRDTAAASREPRGARPAARVWECWVQGRRAYPAGAKARTLAMGDVARSKRKGVRRDARATELENERKRAEELEERERKKARNRRKRKRAELEAKEREEEPEREEREQKKARRRKKRKREELEAKEREEEAEREERERKKARKRKKRRREEREARELEELEAEKVRKRAKRRKRAKMRKRAKRRKREREGRERER